MSVLLVLPGQKKFRPQRKGISYMLNNYNIFRLKNMNRVSLFSICSQLLYFAYYDLEFASSQASYRSIFNTKSDLPIFTPTHPHPFLSMFYSATSDQVSYRVTCNIKAIAKIAKLSLFCMKFTSLTIQCQKW